MLHEYFSCLSVDAVVYYPFKLSRNQLSFQQMKQMYAYCDTWRQDFMVSCIRMWRFWFTCCIWLNFTDVIEQLVHPIIWVSKVWLVQMVWVNVYWKVQAWEGRRCTEVSVQQSVDWRTCYGGEGGMSDEEIHCSVEEWYTFCGAAFCFPRAAEERFPWSTPSPSILSVHVRVLFQFSHRPNEPVHIATFYPRSIVLI